MNRITIVCAVLTFLFFQPFLSLGNHTETSIVIVTGFEPFDQWDVNPSELIVNKLNGTVINDAHIIGLVLPVDYNRSFGILRDALDQYHPQHVISLGLKGSARMITVETTGFNIMREGVLRFNSIDKNGSFTYHSSFPSQYIAENIRQADIPAKESFFAGAYLCNYILYTTLDYVETNRLDMQVGFIHMPPLSSQRWYGMSLESMIEATVIAVETCITTGGAS